MTNVERAYVASLERCRNVLSTALQNAHRYHEDIVNDMDWRKDAIEIVLAGPQPGMTPSESELASEADCVRVLIAVLFRNETTKGLAAILNIALGNPEKVLNA